MTILQKIESDDPTTKYLFHLAICGEVIYTIEKLDVQSESCTTNEKFTNTLNKNNLSSIKLILEKRLQKLCKCDHLYENDGTRKGSKIDFIEQLLVGKQTGMYEYPVSTTTEELLKEINGEGPSVDKSEYSRPQELYAKLRLMLLQALEQSPDLVIDKSKGIDDNLYPYLVAYFNELKSESEFSSLYESGIKYFGSSLSSPSVLLEKLLDSFIKVLNSHLEILTAGFGTKKHNQRETLDSLRELGNNLMANLAYAQAIKVYTQALEIKPVLSDVDFPQLYTNRAIAFIGLNCVPEAISDLNAALVLDRVFTPAWTQLGYCHLYMGNSLVALESYVTALKTAVGEILPEGFPQEELVIEHCKETKKQSLLPQFVKRLSSAIALTEKRAYQQHMSDQTIRKQLSDVRRILAHLRALGPDLDRDDFTYIPVYRDSSLRDVSMRANTQRPNILTPEVTQNLLARNGMETSVITPVETFRRREDTRQSNGTGTPSDDEPEGPFEFDFNRAMPNAVSFAELFRPGSRATPGTNTTRNAETDRNTEFNRSSVTSNERTLQESSGQGGSRPTTQIVDEGPNRRIVVETNAAGTGASVGATIANAISQAFSGNANDGGNGGPVPMIGQIIMDHLQQSFPDSRLRMVNENGTVQPLGNTQTRNTSNNNNTSQTRGNNSANTSNPSTDNDVEMGDVPDLD